VSGRGANGSPPSESGCDLAPAVAASLGGLSLRDVPGVGGSGAWLVCLSDVITLRAETRSITLQRRGGVFLPTLAFADPASAVSFLGVVLEHGLLFHLEGTLFSVEAKRRLRRAPASLLDDGLGNGGGALPDASDRLRRTSSIVRAVRRTTLSRRPASSPPAAGVAGDPAAESAPLQDLLFQFARFTRFVRKSSLLSARLAALSGDPDAERQAAARARALDIHADPYADAMDGDDDGEGREPPPALKLPSSRGEPLSAAAWAAALHPTTGRLRDPVATRYAVYAGGVAPDARPAVWPFILGAHAWTSSSAERVASQRRFVEDYSRRKAEWLRLRDASLRAAAAAARRTSSAPAGERIRVPGDGGGVTAAATDEEDEDAPDAERLAVYRGVEQQIAKDVVRTDRRVAAFEDENSPFLSLLTSILNVYALMNPSIGYCQGMSDLLSPVVYVLAGGDRYTAAAEAAAAAAAAAAATADSTDPIVDKDTLRRQRSCGPYRAARAERAAAAAAAARVAGGTNGQALPPPPRAPSPPVDPAPPDIGVEALAFWSFESLMRRTARNFRLDQSGVQHQLDELRLLMARADADLHAFFLSADPEMHVCFRWLLVRFKRELPFPATLRLWEVLWAAWPMPSTAARPASAPRLSPEVLSAEVRNGGVGSDRLYLYAAVGLLVAHRARLTRLPPDAFDVVLRYVNDLAGRMDVDFLLDAGERLWQRLDGPPPLDAAGVARAVHAPPAAAEEDARAAAGLAR